MREKGVKAKSKPIPTRFDQETTELFKQLAEETGLDVSEIIRRSVSYSMNYARETKDLTFLLGDPDKVVGILDGDGVSDHDKT